MKRKLFVCVILALYACLFTFSLYPVDIYVDSVTGSDFNSGTLPVSPLKSLEQARFMARSYLGLPQPVFIHLAGTFYLESAFFLTNEDSGYLGNPVVYKKWDGKEAVITGGKALELWNLYKDGIYMSDTGALSFEVLYEKNFRGTKRSNLLDVISPGDFFQNSGILYYYKRFPLSLNPEIFIPQTSALIQLEGVNSNLPIHDIRFEELTFSFTNADFSAGGEKAMIHVKNGERIALKKCRILNAGSSAILFKDYSVGNEIVGNRIEGFKGNGISFSGEASGIVLHRDNIIENNMITRGGGAGISLFQSGFNRIENNEITKITGFGIVLNGNSLFTNTTMENKIRNNVIRSIMSDSLQSSGIYGADTSSGNLLEFNRIYELLGNGANTISGIYLGPKARNFKVTGNLLHNIHHDKNDASPLFIAGIDSSFINNVVALNDYKKDITINSGTASQITFKQNICYSPGAQYFFHFTQTFMSVFSDCSDNLFYHPDYNTIRGNYKVLTPSGSMDISDWENIVPKVSGNRLYQDPLFLEPATGAFIVNGASPAFNTNFVNINHEVIGLKDSFSSYFAGDRLEAEKSNSRSGVDTNPVTSVQFDGNGEYIVFNDIVFNDTILSALIRCSVSGVKDSISDRGLEIRLDSPSGELLGSVELNGTDESFQYISFPIKQIAGSVDICLMLKGNGAARVSVDWVEFKTQLNPPIPDEVGNQVPVATFLTPFDGGFYSVNTPLSVKIEALDFDGSIEKLKLFVNDVEEALSFNDFLETDIKGLAIGEYLLRAEVTDNEGEVSNTTVRIFIKEPPDTNVEIQITQPLNQAIFPKNSDIKVVANIKDESAQVFMVEFYFNNLLLFFDLDSPYEYLWHSLGSGEYTIEVRALDNQRRPLVSNTVTILVDYDSSNLLGHWSLDDGGGIAHDDSGHKHDGIVNDAYSTQGMVGDALQFDGNGAVVTNLSLMNNLRHFTMTGWIKPQNFGVKKGIFGQYGAVVLGFNGIGILQFWTAQGGIMDFNYPYALNEWHHVAAVGDGNYLRIYLDGIPSKPFRSSTTGYGSSGSSFNIGGGGFFDPVGNFFEGTIDDVYLYNVALPALKIRNMAREHDNLQPTIRIVNPRPESELYAPLDLDLQVEVYDGDPGSYIRLVEYIVNGKVLASVSKPPFNYKWSNVPPKTYTLVARAYDRDNAQAEEEVIFSVVYQGDNLLAHWDFNSGNESIAYDASARENHGKIENARQCPGVIGAGLRFNGNGSVVSTPGLVNNLKAFTLAGWARPVSIGNRIGLWGQDGVIEFGFANSNTVAVWTEGGGHLSAVYPFEMEEWHHIAVIGTGEGLSIYFDAKIANKMSLNTNNYGEFFRSFNIGGGGIFDTYGNFFDGDIDEVYVFNKALNLDELKALADPLGSERPNVRIISPQNNSVIGFPSSNTISVEINTGAECSFTYLEVYLGAEKLFSDSEAPYIYKWELEEDLEPQEVTIMVKAFTSCGLWNSDSITVQLEPLSIPEEEMSTPEPEDIGNNEDFSTEHVSIFDTPYIDLHVESSGSPESYRVTNEKGEEIYYVWDKKAGVYKEYREDELSPQIKEKILKKESASSTGTLISEREEKKVSSEKKENPIYSTYEKEGDKRVIRSFSEKTNGSFISPKITENLNPKETSGSGSKKTPIPTEQVRREENQDTVETVDRFGANFVLIIIGILVLAFGLIFVVKRFMN